MLPCAAAALLSVTAAIITLAWSVSAQPYACQNVSAPPIISISTSLSPSCLRGRAGLVTRWEGNSCDPNAHYGDCDANNLDVSPQFPVRLRNSYYPNLFVGLVSYVSFGCVALDVSPVDGLLRSALPMRDSTQAFPVLLIGTVNTPDFSDYPWASYVGAGADALGWRIRYEGCYSVDLNVCDCDAGSIVWELLVRFDGSLQLCAGPAPIPSGYGGLTGFNDGVVSTLDPRFTSVVPNSSTLISSCYTMDALGPLSLSVAPAITCIHDALLSVSFRPVVAVQKGDALIVTLTGSAMLGGALVPASVSSPVGGISIYRVGNSSNGMLVINVSFVADIPAGSALYFSSITSISNPQSSRPFMSNITAALVNSSGSVIVRSTSASISAIASTLGDGQPSFALSAPDIGARDIIVTVTMTPSVRLPSNGTLIVTLAGLGLSLAANTAVTFLAPSAASARASISYSNTTRPVVSVVFSRGGGESFAAGEDIVFSFGPITLPSAPQDQLRNVSAVLISSEGVAVAASCTGVFPAIKASLGPNKPNMTLSHVNGAGSLSVTFTAYLSFGSRFVVTLTGAAISCAANTQVVFSKPPVGAAAVASCALTSETNTLTVIFASEVSFQDVSFTVGVVAPICSGLPPLSNLSAAIAGPDGAVSATSRAGVLVWSSYSSAAQTVQQRIASAIGGVVTLDSRTYSGPCNCDNYINTNVPMRALGITVTMKGAGSLLTIVDCSGTRMRCLIVTGTSIIIQGIAFRGGSSPDFVSSFLVAELDLFYNIQSAAAPPWFDEVPRSRSGASRRSLHEEGSSHNGHGYVSRSLPHVQGTPRLSAGASTKAAGTATSQSYPAVTIATGSSGGCIFVSAAGENVILIDVVVSQCRGTYGGGGFFNVSSVNAQRVRAMGNIARQGAGLYVYANTGSSFTACAFSDNTVGTDITSVFSFASSPLFGDFTSNPDAAAAAGGGLWVSHLKMLADCSFVRNIAIAGNSLGSGSQSTFALSGSHALGSGAYVLVMMSQSSISGSQWESCTQRCSGWCVAAGTLFVYDMGNDCIMNMLDFDSCMSSAVIESSAVGSGKQILIPEAQCPTLYYGIDAKGCRNYGTSCGISASSLCAPVGPSVAVASGILLVDASKSQSSLIISNVRGRDLTVQAVGYAGGCLLFGVRSIVNLLVSNLNANNCMTRCAGLGCTIYAPIALNMVKSVAFRNITMSGMLSNCWGSSCRIRGTTFVFMNASNMSIQTVSFENVVARSRGNFSLVSGGAVIFSATNCSLIDVAASGVSIDCTGDRCGVFSSVMRGLIIRDFLVTQIRASRIHLACAPLTDDVEVYNWRQAGDFDSITDATMGCQVEGVLFHFQEVRNLKIDTVSFSDASMVCSGTRSFINGGMLAALNIFDSLMVHLFIQNVSLFNMYDRRIDVVPFFRYLSLIYGGAIYCEFSRNLSIYDSTFMNISLSVFGSNSTVIGGFIYLAESQNVSILNVTAARVTLSSRGRHTTIAIGGFIAVGVASSLKLTSVAAQNIVVNSIATPCSASAAGFYAVACDKCLLLDASFDSLSCSDIGNYSRAYGCSVVVLSGDINISSSKFRSSRAACRGSSCVASGGAIAFSSSLLPDAQFFCRAALSNVMVSSSDTSCCGSRCLSSGGALSVSASQLSNNMIFNLKNLNGFENISKKIFKQFVVGLTPEEPQNIPFRGNKSDMYYAFSFGEQEAFEKIRDNNASTAAIENFRLALNRSSTLRNARPPSFAVTIEGCAFSQNAATVSTSDNICATDNSVVRGGAVSFEYATVWLLRSSVTDNLLQPSESSTSATGGGVFVGDIGTVVRITSTNMSGNSASLFERSAGGALGASRGGASIECSEVTASNNSATRGGAFFVDGALLQLLNSRISNNVAQRRGGGFFAVSKRETNCSVLPLSPTHCGNSTIILNATSVTGNTLLPTSDPSVTTLGSACFVSGDVLMFKDDRSEITLQGDVKLDTNGAFLSFSPQSSVARDGTSCSSGNMLRMASTMVESVNEDPGADSLEKMIVSGAGNCFPTCSVAPILSRATIFEGWIASCTPCPNGFYSLQTSSRTNDTISTYCRICPLGASCSGGNKVDANPGYWGWQSHKQILSASFIRLAEGYGCDSDCSGYAPCNDNRTGALCGGCADGFSLAFFTSQCVQREQCSSRKAAALFFMSIAYAVLFSAFLMYEKPSKADTATATSVRTGGDGAAAGNAAGQISTAAKGAHTTPTIQPHTRVQSVTNNSDCDTSRSVLTHASQRVGGNPSPLTRRGGFRSGRGGTGGALEPEVPPSVTLEALKGSISAEKHFKAGHSSVFQLLMWFYQMIGLLLTMHPNPMDYFDAGSVISGAVSAIFGTVPISQVINNPSMSMCVAPDLSQAQIIGLNILFYLIWAIIMLLLSVPAIWRPIYAAGARFVGNTGQFWEHFETATEAMAAFGFFGKVAAIFMAAKWTLEVYSLRAAVLALRAACVNLARKLLALGRRGDRVRAPGSSPTSGNSSVVVAKIQVVPPDVRGKAWLDWMVATFSAILSLLFQSVTCVDLGNLPEDNEFGRQGLRWYFDGRVVCFSNSGQLSGIWQIFALIFLIFFVLSPLVLGWYMNGCLGVEQKSRTAFQSSAVKSYTNMFTAPHWMIVMFYERVALLVCTLYFKSTGKLWQSYYAFGICLGTLVLDNMFRPFKDKRMQRLSFICCCALVVVSAVMIRSQALLSVSQDITTPDDGATVQATIGIILTCILVPLAVVTGFFRCVLAFLMWIWQRLKIRFFAKETKRAAVILNAIAASASSSLQPQHSHGRPRSQAPKPQQSMPPVLLDSQQEPHTSIELGMFLHNDSDEKIASEPKAMAGSSAPGLSASNNEQLLAGQGYLVPEPPKRSRSKVIPKDVSTAASGSQLSAQPVDPIQLPPMTSHPLLFTTQGSKKLSLAGAHFQPSEAISKHLQERSCPQSQAAVTHKARAAKPSSQLCEQGLGAAIELDSSLDSESDQQVSWHQQQLRFAPAPPSRSRLESTPRVAHVAGSQSSASERRQNAQTQQSSAREDASVKELDVISQSKGHDASASGSSRGWAVLQSQISARDSGAPTKVKVHLVAHKVMEARGRFKKSGSDNTGSQPISSAPSLTPNHTQSIQDDSSEYAEC